MVGAGVLDKELINLDFWMGWPRRFYNVRTYDDVDDDDAEEKEEDDKDEDDERFPNFDDLESVADAAKAAKASVVAAKKDENRSAKPPPSPVNIETDDDDNSGLTPRRKITPQQHSKKASKVRKTINIEKKILFHF